MPTDIKELQERLRELEEENERLRERIAALEGSSQERTILGLSNEAVVQLSPDLRITYVNHVFEQLFGVSRAELIGKKIDQLERLGPPRIEFSRLYKLAVSSGNSFSTEFCAHDASGKLRYFRAVATVADTGMVEFLVQDQSKLKLIEETFKKYVSPKVIDELIRNEFDLREAKRMDITILFADLRGFTKLCASGSPFMIKQIIDEFVGAMAEIIVENDATLDKIVGDEVMALFGAPIPSEDHALQAVEVAVLMQQKHAELVRSWKTRGMPAPTLGIGINTGEAVVGNVGSERRMNYTALGHSVNLAHRLCEAARPYEILVSSATFERIRELIDRGSRPARVRLKFRQGPDLYVKGMSRPIKTVTVSGE